MAIGKSGTDVVTFPEFVAGVRSCLVLEQLFVRAELLFRAVEKKGRSIWGSDGLGEAHDSRASAFTTDAASNFKSGRASAAASANITVERTVDAADFIRYLKDGRRAATLLGLGRGKTFRLGEVDDVLDSTGHDEIFGEGGDGSWERAKTQLLADDDVQKAVLAASGGGGASPGRVLLREFVVCLFRLV